MATSTTKITTTSVSTTATTAKNDNNGSENELGVIHTDLKLQVIDQF